MALQIIIDGYNLIGSEKGLRGHLEGKRDLLIKQLQTYHETKGYPVIVVFDGWRSGWVHEVEERRGGVTVIFSQQGEKADSVIQRLARKMGSGCVVVTSDREVRRAAEASGAAAIYAGEFSAKLKNIDMGLKGGNFEFRNSNFEFEKDEDSKGLREQRKRGNPRRLSKTERKRRERLRKL